jgi:cytoskeletal protein RodZ
MPTLTRYQPAKLKLSADGKFFLAVLILILLVAFKGVLYRLGVSGQKQTEQNPSVSHSAEVIPSGGILPSAEVKNVKPKPKPQTASPAPASVPTLAPAPAPAVVSTPAPTPAPAIIHRISGGEDDDNGGGGDN